MVTSNLKQKVQAAQEAVKDVEESLRSKAFEIVLQNLLTQDIPITPPAADHLRSFQAIQDLPYDQDVADVLANKIDSTAYPRMYSLKNSLERSLYLLLITRNDHKIDGLTPSQISKLLTLKFRLPSAPPAISMALMNRLDLVDRKETTSKGGKAFEYRIMHPGEQYLTKLFENKTPGTVPSSNVNNANTIKKIKKNKAGLKERILQMKQEKFFSKPREAIEVEVKLRTEGFNYATSPIRIALLRLVKNRMLKRTLEIKDEGTKKPIYKYCDL